MVYPSIPDEKGGGRFRIEEVDFNDPKNEIANEFAKHFRCDHSASGDPRVVVLFGGNNTLFLLSLNGESVMPLDRSLLDREG
jgi:hypothetical protein